MIRTVVAMVLVAACSKEAPVDKTQASKAHEKAHAAIAAPVAPRPRPAQLTQVTIKALGMYCEETCPMKVRMALADMPAVYELGFDVANESIFVSYDASLGTPKEVTKPMLVAIKSAGFDPWLAKETWPEGASASVQVVPRS